MYLNTILVIGIVIIISLTYQHIRSICSPKPFHICTEIERGHFSKSKMYPTRASLKAEAGTSNTTNSSIRIKSNVKIKPTKSSISLTTNSTFLKIYLTGLFGEYSSNEEKISSKTLLELLQHRSKSQINITLPVVVMNLNEKDMINFIQELEGSANMIATNVDGLFRPVLPPIGKEEEKYLKKSKYNRFMKKLTKKKMQDLESLILNASNGISNGALTKGHLACIHLVIRSNQLLLNRKKELGNLFDAYDVSLLFCFLFFFCL